MLTARVSVTVLRKAQGDDGAGGKGCSWRAHQKVPVRLFLRGCFVLLVALPLGGVTVPGVMPWLLGAGMLVLIVYTLRLLDKQVDVKDEERLSFRWMGIHKYFWGLTWWALVFALWGFAVGMQPPAGQDGFYGWWLRVGGVFAFDLCAVVSEGRVCAGGTHLCLQLFYREAVRGVGSAGASFFRGMGILVLSCGGKKKYYCFIERLGKPQAVADLENDLKRRAWFYKQMRRKKF